jgi:hypothetical protein
MTDSWTRDRADELLISILLRSSRGQQRDALEAALNEAEQRVIARLQHPDKALIEAYIRAVYGDAGDLCNEDGSLTKEAPGVLRALAAFLSSPPEEG